MASIVTPNFTLSDLNRQVVLHKVVLSPASDTAVTVWCRIVAYPDLTYWTASSLGFVIRLPDDFLGGDWQEWYFVYGGLNYYCFQFWVLNHSQFVFIEGRSPTFSTVQIALSDLNTFDSDALAAAAGLEIGDYYRAGSGHDRADYGSITTRLE